MLRAGIAGITLAAMAATWTAGGARADTNIALGKTVSIVATDPDPSAGFNNGTAGNLQNITNGIDPSGRDSVRERSRGRPSDRMEWRGLRLPDLARRSLHRLGPDRGRRRQRRLSIAVLQCIHKLLGCTVHGSDRQRRLRFAHSAERV